MSLVIEALRLRWPNGIPAQDYEKMLSVVHVFGDAPAPAAVPAARQDPRWKVGAPTIERVRQALLPGPTTAREIVAATKLDSSTVYAALKQLGATTDGKTKRGGTGGSGCYPNLWRLPAK